MEKYNFYKVDSVIDMSNKKVLCTYLYDKKYKILIQSKINSENEYEIKYIESLTKSIKRLIESSGIFNFDEYIKYYVNEYRFEKVAYENRKDKILDNSISVVKMIKYNEDDFKIEFENTIIPEELIFEERIKGKINLSYIRYKNYKHKFIIARTMGIYVCVMDLDYSINDSNVKRIKKIVSEYNDRNIYIDDNISDSDMIKAYISIGNKKLKYVLDIALRVYQDIFDKEELLC